MNETGQTYHTREFYTRTYLSACSVQTVIKMLVCLDEFLSGLSD